MTFWWPQASHRRTPHGEPGSQQALRNTWRPQTLLPALAESQCAVV